MSAVTSDLPLPSFVFFVSFVAQRFLQSLQLRNLLQRRLINLLDPQMLLQPAVAVETRGRIQGMRRVIELHLFIFGAEAVQVFLPQVFADGIARGKLKEDAFAVGMAKEIHRIVPGVFMKIFADVVLAYL